MLQVERNIKLEIIGEYMYGISLYWVTTFTAD